MDATAWSKHANVYSKLSRASTAPYASLMVDAVLGKLSSHRRRCRVLDVACGVGEASIFTAQRAAAAAAAADDGGVDVVATDFASRMIELTIANAEAANLTNITGVVADAKALPFPNESFDAVMSNFGIFLVPNREQAWQEAIRVLKPQGVLCATLWALDRDVGALPFHKTMFAAMAHARQSFTNSKSSSSSTADEKQQEAKVAQIMPTVDSLRAELLAIDGVDANGFRVHDIRSTFQLSANTLAAVVLDNPALRAMLPKIENPQDEDIIRSSVVAYFLQANNETDPDAPLFMNAAAHLVVAHKKPASST